MDNSTDKCLIISEVRNAVPAIYRRTLPVLMVLTALYLTFAAFPGARSLLAYSKHLHDDLSLAIWALILFGQVFMLLPMVMRISSSSRNFELVAASNNINAVRRGVKNMTLLTLPIFAPSLFLFILLVLNHNQEHLMAASGRIFFVGGLIAFSSCIVMIWIRNAVLRRCLEPVGVTHWLLMLAPGILIVHLLALAAIYYTTINARRSEIPAIELITLLHIVIPIVIFYLFRGIHCGKSSQLPAESPFALGNGIGCYPFRFLTWAFAFLIIVSSVVLILATISMSAWVRFLFKLGG